jgi:hypothetical protein
MNEAKITINGQPLSEGQSRAVRTAVVALTMLMKDPKFNMGEMSSIHYNHLLEVMRIIDETEIVEVLNFIGVLARKNAEKID